MSTTYQTKEEDFIIIQPREIERVNITEDEMLSMLYGADDFENAQAFIEGAKE